MRTKLKLKLMSLIGLMGLISACVEEVLPDSGAVVGVGDTLPAFTVTLSDGSVVDRDDLRGQPSVVVLFNTACEDCRAELPVVDAVSLSLGEKARFLAIAREESEESIAEFWRSRDLTLPYSPQPDRRIYSLFAISGIPQIFVSDASLTIRAVYGPDDTPSEDELTDIIHRL